MEVNPNFITPFLTLQKGDIIYFKFSTKDMSGMGLAINNNEIIILYNDDKSGFDLHGCKMNINQEGNFYKAGEISFQNTTLYCKETDIL